MIYGYASVTIDKQGPKVQVDALKKAGASHVYHDNSRDQRPKLGRLLSTLGKGDTLLVVRIRQLAHSMGDFIDVVGAIQRRGANFRSLSEPWAYIDAEMSEFMLGILSGVTKLERDFLQARIADGRARAKAIGKSLGRPFRLSSQQRRELRNLVEAGKSMRQVARIFNVSPSTAWRLSR